MTKNQHKSLFIIDIISKKGDFINLNLNSYNEMLDKELIKASEEDWRCLLFVDNPSENIKSLIKLYML